MSNIRTKLVGTAIAGVAMGIGVACGLQEGVPRDSSTVGSSAITTSTLPVSSAIGLPPNDRGYVRVESKSGLVRCSVNAELVACQTSADNWPGGDDGEPFHCASVMLDGRFEWVKADLGALEGRVTLENQIYGAQGWTIIASSDGTTFTNDRTGHGMFVSTEKVQPF